MVKSKDFKVLIERLISENEKHEQSMMEIYNNKENREENKKMLKIHQDYIKYHESMIYFIKRLDKEILEKGVE